MYIVLSTTLTVVSMFGTLSFVLRVSDVIYDFVSF